MNTTTAPPLARQVALQVAQENAVAAAPGRASGRASDRAPSPVSPASLSSAVPNGAAMLAMGFFDVPEGPLTSCL